MKIVYMGTPDFSVGALRALMEHQYEVCAVVTQPDKPKGRGKTMVSTPVKEEALRWGLPVFQPRRVREPEFLAQIEALAPDMIVVAAFGQIIPKALLELPKYGCINIHASLLPKYRGAAPIQQCILDGEKESGVTLMRMDEGLDTGDMISRVAVPIGEEETGGSLFDKLSEAGAQLLIDTIPAIADGSAEYEKQPAESPTPYAAMITKQMGLLDFSKSAEEIKRIVQALNPWPSAYAFLNGKTFKIWKCKLEEEYGEDGMPGKTEAIAPGTIFRTDKAGIHVSCGKGSLLLTEVQLEGKKKMETGAFLRGYEIAPGTRLTMEKE